MNSPGAQSKPSITRLLQIINSSHPPPKPRVGYPYGPHFIHKPAKEIDRLLLCGVDCDEVYPNIFVGDEGSARNKDFLRAAGITHVLNTAEGNNFGQVSTRSSYYCGSGIQYLGLDLLDVPNAPISKYFESSSAFIDAAINSGAVKIIVCGAVIIPSSRNGAGYAEIKSDSGEVQLYITEEPTLIMFVGSERNVSKTSDKKHGAQHPKKTSKVLVHCLMGLSRSATLVAAYLITEKSMSAEGALRTLRSQRDVRPNDGFLMQLVKLEENTQ